MTEQASQTKEAHAANKPVAPFSMPIIDGLIDPLRQGVIQ